jgi:hypothetical protein
MKTPILVCETSLLLEPCDLGGRHNVRVLVQIHWDNVRESLALRTVGAPPPLLTERSGKGSWHERCDWRNRGYATVMSTKSCGGPATTGCRRDGSPCIASQLVPGVSSWASCDTSAPEGIHSPVLDPRASARTHGGNREETTSTTCITSNQAANGRPHDGIYV